MFVFKSVMFDCLLCIRLLVSSRGHVRYDNHCHSYLSFSLYLFNVSSLATGVFYFMLPLVVYLRKLFKFCVLCFCVKAPLLIIWTR
jgi:hypothetical protein